MKKAVLDKSDSGCLPLVGFLLVILAPFAICMAVAFLNAHLQARAFNRATGSNVSTWDAMFVPLRVEGRPK